MSENEKEITPVEDLTIETLLKQRDEKIKELESQLNKSKKDIEDLIRYNRENFEQKGSKIEPENEEIDEEVEIETFVENMLKKL